MCRLWGPPRHWHAPGGITKRTNPLYKSYRIGKSGRTCGCGVPMDQRVRDEDRVSAEAAALRDGAGTAQLAPLTHSELRAIIASLMLAMFLAALDQTIVAT